MGLRRQMHLIFGYSWELAENVRTSVARLRCQLEERQHEQSNDSKLLEEALEQLRQADEILDDKRHRSRAYHSSHFTVAEVHRNTARTLGLRTAPRDHIPRYMPGIVETVREHLPATDARRIAVENIAKKEPPEFDVDDQILIADALDAAYSAALREKLRAESFVRIVQWVTWSLFVLAAALAAFGAIWTHAAPLCFSPQASPEQAETGNFFTNVCLTKSKLGPGEGEYASLVSHIDYLVIEFIGLVAAGVAAASALRKIRGTATPYPIPVSLAVLKLPTGALTAPLGLLLMRGGFVPGLSALDSSAQIVAWALIFGYSQELFTKLVDKRGQAVLDAVRGPGSTPV